MSEKKNNHLKLVLTYIVKCRLEQGKKMSYHTHIVYATSTEEAIEQATKLTGKEAKHHEPYVVKIEYTTKGTT